jgi:hypothetical protein
MRDVLYDPTAPVVVRTVTFDYEAELARALLDAADVPVLLIRETHVGLGPGGARIVVRRVDVPAALEALQELDVPLDETDGPAEAPDVAPSA